MCSVFRNALFCPFFLCFRAFFPLLFLRALGSAGLQMQSIALVLSQTDFCAALGHLGQPSLASAALARNRFKAAILCPLEQKGLQTANLNLRSVVFQRITSRVRRLLYATRAKQVRMEVLASELHFCRDLNPFFWLFNTKRSNVVIKEGTRKL